MASPVIPENIALAARSQVERMTGIEPALSAWEADVLPLNYIRRSPSASNIRRAPRLSLPRHRTGTGGLRVRSSLRTCNGIAGLSQDGQDRPSNGDSPPCDIGTEGTG
jgi:hypothetical protein